MAPKARARFAGTGAEVQAVLAEHMKCGIQLKDFAPLSAVQKRQELARNKGLVLGLWKLAKQHGIFLESQLQAEFKTLAGTKVACKNA